MNLLRVAIASLLLPAGAQVQAADVSRMAPVVRTQPSHSGASVPDVSKVPGSPGPVPLPYPNVLPPAATVKDRAPVTTVIKRDQVPIKKELTKIPGGQQGGTVVRVPAVQKKAGIPQAGGPRLTPLDDPSPPKSDLSSDDAQLVQRKLQEKAQQESRHAQSISDISKQKDDTAKSVIQNMK